MPLIQLTANQRRIIDQVIHHGLTCAPAVMHAFTWSDAAAHGSLGRLKDAGWFWSFLLWPGALGYRLSRAACLELGLAPAHARPIGDQGLVGRTAILLDCARRRVSLLTAESLAGHWPGLETFAAAGHRYVPGESVPVAAVYIDHGCLPQRVPAKVNTLFYRHARQQDAARQLRSGAVGVRILTGTPGKAEAICRALAASRSLAPWPDRAEHDGSHRPTLRGQRAGHLLCWHCRRN